MTTAKLPTAQQTAEIDDFLAELHNPAPRTQTGGRLIFALDATASREATWDRACATQGELFNATVGIGCLNVQLMFYRGFAECKVSRWLTSAAELHAAMRLVNCVGGHTQIFRILDHAIRETAKAKVDALIFVGDALEEEPDPLCQRAGELGRLGVPVFIFQEGSNPDVARVFKQIAQLSGGAHLGFDIAGIAALKAVLGAVAVFAAGGRAALEAYGQAKGGEVLRLASQLKAHP